MADAKIISLAAKRREHHPAGSLIKGAGDIQIDVAKAFAEAEEEVDAALLKEHEDFTLAIGTLKVSTKIGLVTDELASALFDQVEFRVRLRLRALAEELEDAFGVATDFGIG